MRLAKSGFVRGAKYYHFGPIVLTGFDTSPYPPPILREALNVLFFCAVRLIRGTPPASLVVLPSPLAVRSCEPRDASDGAMHRWEGGRLRWSPLLFPPLCFSSFLFSCPSAPMHCCTTADLHFRKAICICFSPFFS